MGEITIRGIRMVLRASSWDALWRCGDVDAYGPEGQPAAFGRLAYNRVEFYFQRQNKYPWLHEQADRRAWIVDDYETGTPNRPYDTCTYELTDEQTAVLVADVTPAETEPTPEISGPVERVQEFGIGGINRDADQGAETEALIESVSRAAEIDTTDWRMCDCGHRCPSELVMSASMGTSCPDCYDRMSN